MVAEWETVSRVTPEQVAFYREKGYLKFGRIFTPAEMDALREHVDAMIAALPEGKRPEEMDVPHFEDPWLFRYLTDPRVLDVIEGFIGPDIVLWSSHFIAKPQGDGQGGALAHGRRILGQRPGADEGDHALAGRG